MKNFIYVLLFFLVLFSSSLLYAQTPLYTEGTCSDDFEFFLADNEFYVYYGPYNGNETFTIEQETGGTYTATESLQDVESFYTPVAQGIYKITLNDPDGDCTQVLWAEQGSSNFDTSGGVTNATDCFSADGIFNLSGGDNTGQYKDTTFWTVYKFPEGEVIATGFNEADATGAYYDVDLTNLLPGTYCVEVSPKGIEEQGDAPYIDCRNLYPSTGETCPSWILPIELKSFNAVYNDRSQSVDLHWTTATQFNVEKLEIERSVDNRNFEVIHTLNNIENSAKDINYYYEDTRMGNAKTVYYRIKSIDLDGSYEYSEVESIDILGKGLQLTLFPNPVKDRLSIDVSSDGVLNILNINGRVVKTYNINEGLNQIGVDDLPNGIYLLKMIDDSFQTISKRLIISK